MPARRFLLALLGVVAASRQAVSAPPQTLWERYRTTVHHPAATRKADDLKRARGNIARYAWARGYRDEVEKSVAEWPNRLTTEFLEQMIPATTPGAILFTPCPACRDLKKPTTEHGQWEWDPHAPERLVCAVCHTVYPNARYPESIVRRAAYDSAQEFSYYGGEPFKLFNYPYGRPSFTGNIREHKVEFMATLCRNFAEAYALTEKPAYALEVRRILLRFARVYPHYLVHCGYGEYADGDPRIAAAHLDALPTDEITPPPSLPDRKLYVGFWMAGRAASTGQEGHFLRRMAESYDLTCEAVTEDKRGPVYSDAERRRIESDLLLDGATLLTADTAVNNKSVGNATAAALIGMTVGDPTLVRFGRDVFRRTLEGWFLADGATPESWSYSLMALNGIEALGQAFRGYSDPPGYRDTAGKRLENLDLYDDPAYRRVWEAMFDGLQGDLRYPPLADSHRKDGIGARYAEMMAANYPDDKRYRALRAAISGGGSGDAVRDPAAAIYLRDPAVREHPGPLPALVLPSRLFPALHIGYLRGGSNGRDSTLVLSASDWGAHHHRDSLSLYWWQNGSELLSDLGYLWDHPLKTMTARTLAHNTVLVDGADQVTTGRGGDFVFFQSGGDIQAMEAESHAYAQTDLYRRTVVQIDSGKGRRYVVDIFRVHGGTNHDYVFHGPNGALDGAPPESGGAADTETNHEPRLDLARTRPILADGASGQYRLDWRVTDAGGKASVFSALWPTDASESAFVGDGWGQKDYHNTDVGAVLPYIVRRRRASVAAPSAFVSVFEQHPASAAFVRRVQRLPVSEDGGNVGIVALAVETASGVDYVISCPNPHPNVGTLLTSAGPISFTGRLTVVRTVQGRITMTFTVAR